MHDAPNSPNNTSSLSLAKCTLDERFDLLAPLGIGGMGEVYRAREREGGAVVALKLLRNQVSVSLRARFLREARLASQIRHPHVIRVRSHSRKGDQLYLVMDLVKGTSLTQLIEGQLPYSSLCTLLVQVLGALAYVHARGILHRDIKPDNILISHTSKGLLHAWLTDFGIAGLIEHERGETRLTQEGSMLGTPGFMAPEQAASSGQLTSSVDLYPIGVILYQALSGQMPFEGTVWSVLMAKSMQDAPLPINLPEWPEGMWSIVERLLARDPSQRFRSASEVIAELQPFASTPEISKEEWRRLSEEPQEKMETLSRALRASMPFISGSFLTPSTSINEPKDEVWGREEVTKRLLEIAGRAEQCSLQIVLLDGPMGSGKSLLARKIALGLAESGRFTLMHGDYMTRSSGDGLRLAVERVMGTIGLSPEEVKRRVEEFMQRRGVEDVQEQQAVIEFLRPPRILGGLEEGQQRRSHHALILRLLRQISKEQPLLLILDDVHHDDVDFAGFAENAIIEASYEPFPLFILATLRKDESALVLKPLKRFLLRRIIYHIALEPIKSEVLAMALVRHHRLPFPEALHVAERSGGNPLYAQLLAQSDYSDITDSRSLPEQLRELMIEQFDKSLETHDSKPLRELAKRAALLGSPVDVELFESFSEDLKIDFDDALDVLIDLRILIEDHQTELLNFQHPLLGESLLLSVQGRKARKLHLRAAQLREAFAPEEVEAEAMAIGDHYILARRNEEAISWWLRGLQYEISAGDFRRAIHCGTQALEQLEEQDPRVIELRKSIACLLREQGQDLERVIEMLRPLSEREANIALPALEICADMQQECSDFTGWAETIEQMKSIVTDDASDEARRAFERAYLFWLNNIGEYVESQRLAHEYLAANPERPDALYILNRLFWSIVISHSIKNDPDFDFSALTKEIFRRATSITSLKLKADVLRVRGLYFFRQGDMKGALARINETIEVYRQSGYHTRLVYAMGEKVFILLQDGVFEECITLIAQIRRMGMDPERAVRIPVFDYVAHVLSYTTPPNALLLEIEQFTERLKQPFGIKGILKLARSWLFQSQALFAAELGEWDEVHEKLSALPFFTLGWGLPYEILLRLGGLMLQHLAEVPEDEQTFKIAAHYLKTSEGEWRHTFSSRSESFISEMIAKLDALPRGLQTIDD